MANSPTELFKVEGGEEISNTQIVVTGQQKTVVITTTKRVVKITLD